MDFRAILFFIAIAFISSLLSKNRSPAEPTAGTDRPEPQEHPPPTDKASDVSGNKRKKFPDELEDLFKEIMSGFDKTPRDTQGEQVQARPDMEQSTQKEENIETEQGMSPPENTSVKGVKKVAGDVYRGEIGEEREQPISFNRKSVIRGIIMSEVLQRPKSLRR